MQSTQHDNFSRRHLGVNTSEITEMLNTIGVDSLDQLIDETVPSAIRMDGELNIPEAMSEYAYMRELKETAAGNKVFRTYIGQGYYGTITPSPILRNIFQNPGWYTQYTPYQAEISQGRLEALLNFQTMISDLTSLGIANASLLDEGTAAAEAMHMFYALKNKRTKDDPANEFFVDQHVFAHTIDVLLTRAKPLNIKVVVGHWESYAISDKTFGVLLQYPGKDGLVEDYSAFTAAMKERDIYVAVAADILSLALLTPPGEWGADVALGNTQRLGVPIGFGGPHAAYFATKEEYKRQIPGRIIGVSQDAHGNTAYRMALQTREQHIRREKATSNICTAQALLAIMAGMYGVYHGPDGIRSIAENVHANTIQLANTLTLLGYKIEHTHFFDTLLIQAGPDVANKIQKKALAEGVNLYYENGNIQISLDETVTYADLAQLTQILALDNTADLASAISDSGFGIPDALRRTSAYMEHDIFNTHHTETKFMRYTKSLENKDLSLMHAMIPLGSCTMKLNAATELLPVSWPEFADIHPFVPQDQAEGYRKICTELEQYLCEITGFSACSLQPNSGAQGEFSGLLTIRAYHEDRGEGHRDVSLIPASAHGTNPASAVMAGMKVVVVKTDDHGNIDFDDLKQKAEQYAENLSCLMVTYPSTHGVFETQIKDICKVIHDNGGLVYMDGANMNAQVGLTSPGLIDADVCHLNLHKTFAIPHGGGGPGMGPICVNDKLAPYLPGHVMVKTGGEKAVNAVSAAPWGSASILLISYAYIKMLGKTGVKEATKIAILNANYIKARLEKAYPVLYTGEKGRAAHELIVDLRQFKEAHISAEDIAKRLIDYGFHAPTLSFPVAGTIMIEPTESEGKDELDRFCDAMLEIKKEIEEVAAGTYPQDDNVLVNAPHPVHVIVADNWSHAYSREKAAYPLPYLRHYGKFWVSVSRVDNAYGDRNLMCICPPVEVYAEG